MASDTSNDIIPRKLVIPTGFEPAEREIEMRQRLADALLQMGMTTKDNMTSPLQVLGQLAQAFVGSRMEGRALREQGNLDQQIRGAYGNIVSQINTDRKAGMSDADMIAKYGANPLAQDLIKPEIEGFTEGRKSGAQLVEHNGTIAPQASFVGKPVFNVGDVVKPLFDANNNLVETPDTTVIMAKGASSPMASNTIPYNPNTRTVIPAVGPQPSLGQPPVGGTQPPSVPPAGSIPPIPSNLNPNLTADAIRSRIHFGVNQVESHGHDFNPDGSPVVNRSSGALFGMQVLPSTAANPGFGVPPARARTAAEFDRVGNQYLDKMLSRYSDPSAAIAAYSTGPGTIDHLLANQQPIPMGYVNKVMSAAFPNHQKPPDGMTVDGHPYWLVNGKPFDNPDGL